MKTMRLLAYFFFGVIFFTTIACRDDDGDNGGNNGGYTTGKCIINASISGNISKTFNSDLTTSTTIAQQGMVLLVGTKVNNLSSVSSYQITLPQNISIGTYDAQQLIEKFSTLVYVDNSNDSSSGYVAGADGNNNFTVKITTAGNGKIEGTFNGDMFNANNKKITVSGDFKGAY